MIDAAVAFLGRKAGVYIMLAAISGLLVSNGAAWVLASARKAEAASERAAHATTKADHAQALSAGLQSQADDVTRLQLKNKELQDVITAQGQDLAAFDSRRRAAERVRDRAQHAAAIAGATAGALREHAQAAESDLERSGADIERFGREAVQASTAAHAFHDTLQAREPLINFGTRRSPFTTTAEESP